MTRGRWVEKIRGFIARVEAGEVPARIREIYCFGSFARGALEPNDLDLIVIHDPPSPETLAPLLKAVKSYAYSKLDQNLRAYYRFQAGVRKVFRRGGERMDVILAESLEAALSRIGDPASGGTAPLGRFGSRLGSEGCSRFAGQCRRKASATLLYRREEGRLQSRRGRESDSDGRRRCSGLPTRVPGGSRARAERRIPALA